MADRVGVPRTTARDWVRRFEGRAPLLASALAAAVVELAGVAPRWPPDRAALAVLVRAP